MFARPTPTIVNACHYARLALAVWLAEPENIRSFTSGSSSRNGLPRWRKRRPMRPNWSAAGPGWALRGRQVDQVLARNLRLFHLLGEGMLPKLVMGNYCASGRIQYPDAVFGCWRIIWGSGPSRASRKAPGHIRSALVR